jgi:hypothetical protein
VTDRGGLRIVPDIPGRNRSEQMVNAVRLAAYAVERLQNRRAARVDDVIAVCKAHRCYDAKNMASTLRRRGSAFVFGGPRRHRTVALSESGRKEAEQLIQSLLPRAVS